MKRSPLGRWTRTVVLWLASMAFLLPFAWMLSASFKPDLEVFDVPPRWIPENPTLGNFAEIWAGEQSIARYFLNSILVSAVCVTGDLLTSSLAGYGFARFASRARDRVFGFYLATAIVPGQLLLIPRFLLFRQLGLYDTLWALILPGVFTVFGTFLMRQAFVDLPADFGEAARLDGAGEFTIFWRIYLPLVRPMLAALAIISFVSSWNDFETPLVMLSTESLYTLPLGLTQFIDADGGLSAGLAMAAGVSALVPVALVVILFQRQFISAMTMSGLK